MNKRDDLTGKPARILPISETRLIISRLILGLGMFFTFLAIGFFVMPFVAAAVGDYEGGDQSLGGYLFYLLLGFPAFAITLASIFVRGWREARAGYVTLACLFGIPALVIAAALISAGYDALRN